VVSGWDHSLHTDPAFQDDRIFCSCGEELVYAVEHERTKCLKCIQDEEAKAREEGVDNSE
jgi:hypothetical protein